MGRFCYRYDPDADTFPPPPEPERIQRARTRLLGVLDSAAGVLPGDEWIAGQRVRYLLDGHEAAQALEAARRCRAIQWWCAALTGLALHVRGEYAAADSAYRVALGAMPRDEWCRWTDLSALLDGAMARRYRRLDCDLRAALAERVWWLAQPLYSVPGNDRRTEHLARATMARIEQEARSTYGVPWGDDMREMMLRYGWPTYWTREPPGPGAELEPRITGHDPYPALPFLPRAMGGGADSGDPRTAAWTLDARWARERYAPGYAAAFVPLAHQVAVFRHGDSCLVVAAYDISGDTGFARGSRSAALVLAPDERSAPVLERREDAAPVDEILATAACEPQLLSLELRAPGARRVARARHVVLPPGAGEDGVALSDILLFDPPDSLPTELAAALPHLRGAATARLDRRLGLFWEVYGLDREGEAITVELTVVPERTGWLRRATESLGLARRRASVALQWREIAMPHGARTARALALDLTGLEPGRYRLEVAVAAGGGRATATRDLTVGRGEAEAHPIP